MRSQGQVRFIRVSSRLQMIVAGIVVALLLAWAATMATAAYSQYAAQRDRVSLRDREVRVATAEERVAEYRDDISAVAADLEKRQEVLEQLSEAYFGELPANQEAGQSESGNATEAARTIGKVSAVLPMASSLARAEHRQIAFVERLTHFADSRAEKAAKAMRKLGLNPHDMFTAANNHEAQGGPLVRISTSKDGSLDPRFRRLGHSLARMDALERGLAGIPQVLPAQKGFITSSFGYRDDPFNRSAAFHSGLDFRGPVGAPVYAAAKGKISFAGIRHGYGKCVEIDHGNGLTTRYAHMSAFKTRVGQSVDAGTVIGAIGSTGRSTGPHLHFEVRVHDRPVNPRPFLESAPRVLKEARTHGAAGGK